ncbi:MAG: glycosyltransferase family 4 protein [Chloroflexi bacterium]|nr:glycosyltransferase family 4 protein [Chloroflexota bacterium]
MHIVIDARTVTPHFPGIGRYVSNLLRALPPIMAPGEQLTLLTLSDVPTAHERAVRVRGGPFSLRQQWEVPRALSRLRADVYHSTYFLMPYRPGVPTVLTVYDLIPILYPEAVSRRARWLFPHLLRLALRAAHRVIAISTATKKDLCRVTGVPESRIDVIPLAPDPRFVPQPGPMIAHLRERLGLPPRYALYVGSNKPHKNLVRLIEAWGLVSKTPEAAGWALVIAGVWDPRYPEARQRARTLGLQDQVRFLGPVDEADLPALYGGAELFVFPSLYEGFGLPVLEAMACGAPVVCSDRASLPEVAGDAALLVDPTDAEALAGAITRLLTDEGLRQEMRRRALARAAEFSWERTACMTLAVYRAMAS